MPRTHIVIDFETTGLFPERGDRVIEVAAVEVVDGRIGRHFQSLANPGRPVSGTITRITGITNAMLAPAPDVASVMRSLAAFVEGAELVAHNASFDHRFLRAEFGRLDLPCPPGMTCTMRLGRRVFPHSPNHKLATLAEHAGITLPERMHRALADATITAHLFLMMMDHPSAQGRAAA
jgi:DNA polymerase-3 subunit epsilon